MINPYESPQTESVELARQSNLLPRYTGITAGTSFLSMAVGSQTFIFWSVVETNTRWNLRALTLLNIAGAVLLAFLCLCATLFCSWQAQPRWRAPIRLSLAFPLIAILIALLIFTPCWFFRRGEESVVIPLAAILVLTQSIVLAFVTRTVLKTWGIFTACGLACALAGGFIGVFQIAIVFNSY